jgi:anion-transporting  ArsA/GET3 family ATPase
VKHLHRIADHLGISIMKGDEPKSMDDLTVEIMNAISGLRNEKKEMEKQRNQAEESRRVEERVRQDTENMTPWERQKYYDSWAGGMS